MNLSVLTQSVVKKLFHYDPVTGIVTRLVRTAQRHQVGEAVGSSGARGYLQTTVGSRKYMLHRLIWLWVYGAWPVADIDHKNRIRNDNRLDNLRAATRSENNHNTGISQANSSGYQGVTWDKSRCRWVANIRAHGKQRHLGRFQTPQAASEAYQAAKRVYHPTTPSNQQGAQS